MSDFRRAGADAARPDGHGYVSTACYHALHDQCRRVCKFCPAECGCECHDAELARPAPSPADEFTATIAEAARINPEHSCGERCNHAEWPPAYPSTLQCRALIRHPEGYAVRLYCTLRKGHVGSHAQPSPAASADVIERAREVVRLWDASSIPPQQQSDHVTFARALLDAVKEADRLRVSRAAIESSLRISEAARARLTGMCAQLWDALAEAAAREGNDGK